jgi:hypothetical protein
MRHLAKLSEGRFERIPVHIECCCGVAGDFSTEDEARYWMQYKHFSKLSGIAYGEFFSANTTDSAPAPASPPESGAEVQSETVGDA